MVGVNESAEFEPGQIPGDGIEIEPSIRLEKKVSGQTLHHAEQALGHQRGIDIGAVKPALNAGTNARLDVRRNVGVKCRQFGFNFCIGTTDLREHQTSEGAVVMEKSQRSAVYRRHLLGKLADRLNMAQSP